MLNRIYEKYVKHFVRGSKFHKSLTQIYRKKGMEIGADCRLYSTDFGSEPYLVHIGNHVTITDNVKFVTHDGGVWVVRYLREQFKDVDLIGQIWIGDNVFIGNNAVILPGVTIGENTIVAAGCIVAKSLEANSVYGGVPAKKICSIEAYINKNQQFFCSTKNMDPDQKRRFYLSDKVTFIQK